MAGAHATLPQELLTAQPVIVVVGPTGIGKTSAAFELAQRLNGEVVVADSRQVYQLLDIATNKPSPERRQRVRYHMIDFIDPRLTFNAAQYVEGARAAGLQAVHVKTPQDVKHALRRFVASPPGRG